MAIGQFPNFMQWCSEFSPHPGCHNTVLTQTILSSTHDMVLHKQKTPLSGAAHVTTVAFNVLGVFFVLCSLVCD